MTEDRYRHRKHSKGILQCHLIFVTKFRKPVLTREHAKTCKQFLMDIADLNGWQIREMETDTDHIHILIEYPPTVSISNIVRGLKQKSTFYMWKRFRPYLRRFYWYTDYLWSDGYFYCSIGEVSEEIIRRYIQNQG